MAVRFEHSFLLEKNFFNAVLHVTEKIALSSEPSKQYYIPLKLWEGTIVPLDWQPGKLKST